MASDAGCPEIKIIAIRIETPDGQLPPAKIRIPDAPMKLANLVPAMQQLCNGIVELAIRREVNHGAPISCHKGCGVCCCQHVPLSPPEVFFLRGYIHSLSYEHRREIEARFEKIKETMEDRGLVERLMKIEDTKEHGMLAWNYFRMGKPCPFLEEGVCSIHKHRPFACREYNVISLCELCADPFKKGIKKIKIPKNMTTATAKLAAELCDVKPMLIPMTLALE